MNETEDMPDSAGPEEALERIASENPEGLVLRGPQVMVGNAGAGSARMIDAEAGNPRRQRGTGRRVTLARQPGGGYSIWMQSRHVQGFCNEWEDVTNFQLPEGIEQQVRINIEVVGEARIIRPEYSGQDSGVEVAEEAPRRDDVLRRAVQAHEERESPLTREDLVGMFNELPRHNQDMIAGQIRANHRDAHGAPLQTAAHPNRLRPESIESMEIDLPEENPFGSVLGDLRHSVRHTLELLERLG